MLEPWLVGESGGVAGGFSHLFTSVARNGQKSSFAVSTVTQPTPNLKPHTWRHSHNQTCFGPGALRTASGWAEDGV